MEVRFFTADVFTDRIFGGNQLAVFPDATEIPEELMQSIAREFNFSETTFVLPPLDSRHTARVRIFTPATELPFAGHPTIGTAHVLAASGRIPLTGGLTDIVFEEGVGPVRVRIGSTSDGPEFVQFAVAQLPSFGPEPPAVHRLAEMLSLVPEDVSPTIAPKTVSCGTPFLLISLKNVDAVARTKVRRELFDETMKGHPAKGVMVFAATGTRPRELRGRMFAPAIGIPEDPATGGGAPGIGGYLASFEDLQSGTLRFDIHQGVEMGHPSLLKVEVDKTGGAVSDVRVGGRTVIVSDGLFHLTS